MSHTIYAATFEQTITHQHVLLRRESQSHILLRQESQSHILLRRIDGASVAIILCLHVLIAHRILLILDMLIIFSEYKYLNVTNRVNNFILLFDDPVYMCTVQVLLGFCHLIYLSFVCKAKGQYIRMILISCKNNGKELILHILF